MEFTQENFDKLLSENGNYKLAIKEERDRRKQAQEELVSVKSKLEDADDGKVDFEKKERKLKEKYESEIAAKDSMIKDLTEKTTSIEAKATKYDEVMTKNLEEKLSKIPEERLEFVKKVLADKNHDDQLDLLDGFITDYTKPDFKAKPKDGGADPKDTTEFDKAKTAGDKIGMINNAPKLNKSE